MGIDRIVGVGAVAALFIDARQRYVNQYISLEMVANAVQYYVGTQTIHVYDRQQRCRD